MFIEILDALYIILTVVALIAVAIKKRGMFPDTGCRMLFVVLLVCSLSYAVLLYTEWSKISLNLDGIEDIIGALLPLCWIFFLYGYVQANTKQAIELSERKFRTLFNQSFQYITTLDFNGKVLEVNSNVIEATGSGDNPIVGVPFWESEWWGGSSVHRDVLQFDFQRAKGGETVTFESVHRLKNGQDITVDNSVKMVRDGFEQPWMLIVEGREITDRIRMENEVRISERKFANIFYDSPVPMVISMRDRNRLVHVNNAFTKIFNYRESELCGRTLADIPLWEDAEEPIVMLRRIKSDGCWTNPCCRMLSLTGEQVTADARVVTMESGNTSFLLSFFIDISKQKMFEYQHQENQENFRQLSDNVQEIFFIVDAERRKYIYTNRAAEQILGVRVDLNGDLDYNVLLLQMVVEEDRKRLGIDNGWLYRTEFINEELRMVRPDNSLVWLQVKTFPIKDTSGKVIRIAGIAHDITEAKKAEMVERKHREELQQVDKMASLGMLVSGVAHEINNPNNFISMNTPMIREVWENVVPVLEEYVAANPGCVIGGLPGREMLSVMPDLFNGIEDGCRRIGSIVSDLKNYARKDNSIYNELVHINDVVLQAGSLLESLIKASTVNYSILLPESSPVIVGNSQKLEQVMVNVLQNACQALESKEQSVTVTVSIEASEAVIRIEDQGGGIAGEHLEKIMDPFFTTRRDCGGTGLGLSVSAGIVKDHKGTIGFTSETGVGTVVTIRIPLYKQDET